MSLLVVCVSAAVAVFALLAILALLMRVILWAFPAPAQDDDVALYAAIVSVAQRAYPGRVVTKIEEVR